MASTARRDRAFWERVVDDFEASGEGHASFARGQGVTVGAFRHWLYRLRRERHGQGAPRATVRLVPVTVAAAPSSELVEVGVDGLVVRFRTGVDAAYVAGLVAALRARA